MILCDKALSDVVTQKNKFADQIIEDKGLPIKSNNLP